MRHWRGPRRKLSAEEIAENAKRKAERDAAAMTCQCCARPILANTGTIAHHGYERPGSGWQTASCMGAKCAPFEVSRERLGYMIERIKEMIAGHEAHIDAIEHEREPVPFEWEVPRRDENGKAMRDSWGRRMTLTKSHNISRGDWDTGNLPEEVKEAIKAAYMRAFDQIEERHLAPWRGRLKNLRSDLIEQTKRYDAWKQTHEWDRVKKEWRAIGMVAA